MGIIGIFVGTAIAFIILIFFVSFISIYNSFIRLKRLIDRSFANIDVLLKQRHDELTNVIEVVKEYAKHEKTLMEELTQARTAYQKASTVGEKANASETQEKAIGHLFAVAENYPDLKASENFLALQKRISEIEDMIADRREYYNDSATNYNMRREMFPSNMVAGMMHLQKQELFKASSEEKKVVDVGKRLKA